MKKKEFKKALKHFFGFDVDTFIEECPLNGTGKNSKVYQGFRVVAIIDEGIVGTYDLNISNTNLTEYDKIAFNAIVFEYASTPIEKRCADKEYHIKHTRLASDFAYLNYRKDTELYFYSCKTSSRDYKTIFTEEEIKLLPDWVKQELEWGLLGKEKLNNE